MFFYIKKLLKYIINRTERLRIEEVKYKGEDLYDIKKPTYIKGIWVVSDKKFFVFKPDTNSFSCINNIVMEICLTPKCTDIPYIENEESSFLISKPCNLFTFDSVKNDYVPYRKKIKICL